MASEAAEGLCARCLISVALKEPTAMAGQPGETPPAPSPAEIAGHFPQLEILELLGRGGMGVVFRAQDTKLLRDVAVKVLPDHFSDDADRLSRLQREAQLLAGHVLPVSTLVARRQVDRVSTW